MKTLLPIILNIKIMKKHYIIIALILFIAICKETKSQVSSQTFTTSGTFIVPAGVTSITIEVVGAGGDGGINGTGGGGGGGYAMGTYTVTPLSTFSVTIGINGGGASGTTVGGFFIQASGGENGVSVANPGVGGGGSGGVGIAGAVNFTGGTGGGGYYTYFGGGGAGAAGALGNGSNGGNTIAWSGICMTPGGAAGISGGTPGGDGGKGAGFTDAACNVTDPSAPGVNYGGGGGGGNGNGGGPGMGADGYCKITWTTTGIDEMKANPILVSQNPFIDKISVLNATGYEIYELIDARGRIVWTGKNINENDFSDLVSDLYILKVQTQSTVQIIKLVKQK